MAEYNGYRSWNAWNVSLWIANDESFYRLAVDAINQTKNLDQAVSLFCRVTALLGDKTPDGAVYNRSSIKTALAGLKD
jgi:hypothetical protein